MQKSRNSIQSLSESDTATGEYQHFIQANLETAKKNLPTRKKRRKKQHADDPRVINARAKVQKAFSEYQITPNKNHQRKLQSEK